MKHLGRLLAGFLVCLLSCILFIISFGLWHIISYLINHDYWLIPTIITGGLIVCYIIGWLVDE